MADTEGEAADAAPYLLFVRPGDLLLRPVDTAHRLVTGVSEEPSQDLPALPPCAFGDDPTPSFSASPVSNVTLSDDADPICKTLLDLRRRHSGQMRSAMWRLIRDDFQHSAPGSVPSVAALQMRLGREVQKHGKWPPCEEEALRLAYAEYSRSPSSGVSAAAAHGRPSRKIRTPYARIRKLMKRHGGCQAWNWTESHIRKKIGELGIALEGKDDATLR